MKNNDNMIKHLILENISEGIIAIDCNQRIKLINRRAKEIFGIVHRQTIGHKGGRLIEGDIVIIGDNSLGFDDGGVSPEDLKVLGVEECIPIRSAFVYIGRYKDKGEYKFNEKNQGEKIQLIKTISDKKIEVSIDFIKKVINVKVNKIEIPYSYVKGIGHMVILDKDTLEVKFYQSKGYTIRKEDIKSILNGGRFSEKLHGSEMETKVLSEEISDVLGTGESIDMLIKCTKGENIDNNSRYDEINGWPVRCSVHPLITDNKLQGAFLNVEDLSEVNKAIKEKDEILKKLVSVEEKAYDPFNVMIGESNAMSSVKGYAKKVALSSSTVLILGESGTGKSVLAKVIHECSNRKKERFVDVNCGALSESLLESELFGYVPGAFTGAKKEGKKGLIEYASGGTLFLDEISEMPLNLQVKLLHVIQNKRIIPVGGTTSIDVDVRFICATNKNLKKMVEEGSFREDLYYRINVMQIIMPPLRERKEDLYPLVQSIIQKICKRDKMQYKALTNEAFNKLYSYNFPGNVRELENIIERALNVAEGNYIDEDSILTSTDRVEITKSLKEIVEEAEKKAIINYLKKYNGDKSKVMEVLGIKKTALYEKIKKYNI